MEKLYYSISEAAEMLGESTSLVRYWANMFPKLLHPRRNNKGNRQFTKEDLEMLKSIHHLVKDKGLTLEGAAKQLSSDKTAVGAKVKVLDSLKSIRKQLVEIREEL